MRLGIVSMNQSQLIVMAELLEPVFGQIEVYDQARIMSGDFIKSNDHIMIVDYSDESIMDLEPVLDMIDKDEPISLLSEIDLTPLAHDERLGWRARIISQAMKSLPDLADEIDQSRSSLMGKDVWVVGSSSGGPDALTSFLSYLPSLPISIILAQHIASEKGTSSMQSLLNARQNNWKVSVAEHGQTVKPSHAYLVPRDSVVSIDGDRFTVKKSHAPTSPCPSINATLRAMARVDTRKMGVIILTGLGDDGAAALKEIQHKTISIYAQTGDECAARSMPDAARDTRTVHFSGTLNEMARKLSKHYGVGLV
tara:strand:- start:18453 stop:19382 length:930 start_codon:yes stop_codon:yes gene_type:complete